MYRRLSSMCSKIKASILLLCLGFMILGTCPIQKLLLSASPIKIETSTQTKASKTPDKIQLSCSYGEEIVKAPLIELTKKSNNNALYFVLLSTLAALSTSFAGKRSMSFVKRKNDIASPIPLYLKNQVFII